MAPSPPAASPAAGKPGAKGKPLSLKSPWTWVIIGGIALVGGAFILWRRSQAASSSSTTGSASTASPDYSGALGTLQDEIGNLQSSGGYGGGTSVVPVTSDSGGAGTTSTVTGPSTGDTTSTGAAGSTSGSSSSGGGTSTATATAPTVSGGHVVSVNNNRAVVAWTGTGASQWKVQIVGPGAINGHTATVGIPQASYSGLEAGHTYTVTVQPLVGGRPAGTPGQIVLKTTTG
jgi:hypothetical protein